MAKKKTPRLCGRCHQPGHRADRCPQTAALPLPSARMHRQRGEGRQALRAAMEISALVDHKVSEAMREQARAAEARLGGLAKASEIKGVNEQLELLATAVKDIREGLIRKCDEVRKLRAANPEIDKAELRRLDREMQRQLNRKYSTR